jgi:hypothetical protein
MSRKGYQRLAFWMVISPQLCMIAAASIEVLYPQLGLRPWHFMMTHWKVYLSTLVLCGIVGAAFQRMSRPPKRVPNCCGNCGYPLALGLERCPECGEVGTRVPVPEREGLL